MKIYFDESYPEVQDKMILGALFISDLGNKYISESFKGIKAKYNIVGELKYADLDRLKKLDAAKEALGLLKGTKRIVYFRSCVLPYSGTGLATIPGASLNQKRVSIYGYSAKTLVLSHLQPNRKAHLYMDREDRIERTKFKTKILKAKATKGGKIDSVISVDSKDESTALVQLCDLLTGAIKQSLYPTNTKKGRFKKQWAEFVAQEFGIVIDGTVARVQSSNKKFDVSFHKVPNMYLAMKMMKKRKQKSRS